MPNKVWMGMLAGFGLTGLTLAFGSLLDSETWVLVLLGIGLSQLVFLIPALIVARKQGKNELFKGMLIAGGIVFLLNAACFGLLAFGGLGGF